MKPVREWRSSAVAVPQRGRREIRDLLQREQVTDGFGSTMNAGLQEPKSVLCIDILSATLLTSNLCCSVGVGLAVQKVSNLPSCKRLWVRLWEDAISIALSTLGQAMIAARKGDPVKPVVLSCSSAKMWERRRWSGYVA